MRSFDKRMYRERSIYLASNVSGIIARVLNVHAGAFNYRMFLNLLYTPGTISFRANGDSDVAMRAGTFLNFRDRGR